ncbi:hypothetical protein P43SY_004690 [Pythium insidiosum]|uniref:Uncharacterized protein n=1 Tax=Pythium insidiosum TaxID=114742 RepID=A0AAD5Q526_PYTIN|nr:hypothetical protein P43SY_004690 [Pythium insidiosum]
MQLRDRYIAAVKEKEALQRENLQLRRLADEYYMKNQGKMRTLLDSNRKPPSTIDQMKATLSHLQRQFTQLLTSQSARRSTQHADNSEVDPKDTARLKYCQLTLVRDELRREKELLHRQFRQVRKLEDKLRWLVDTEGELDLRTSNELVPLPKDCIALEPMTIAECAAIARHWSDFLERGHLYHPARASDLTTDIAFGWQRPCGAHDDIVLLEKRFAATITASLLGAQTTYGCSLLQRVGECHRVLFIRRRHQGPQDDNSRSTGTVVLCSLLELADSTSLILMKMHIEQLEVPGLRESSSPARTLQHRVSIGLAGLAPTSSSPARAESEIPEMACATDPTNDRTAAVEIGMETQTLTPALFKMDLACGSFVTPYEPSPGFTTPEASPSRLVTPPPAMPPLPAPRVAPLSQEEKQERQRMHVRRSYYKKRNYIRSLREQVDELEKQYAAALKAKPDAPAAASLGESPASLSLGLLQHAGAQDSNLPDLDMDLVDLDLGLRQLLPSMTASSPDSPASPEAIQLFMRLSGLRDALRRENDELKKALVRYANFVRRVEQTIEDAEQDAEDHPAQHLDTMDFNLSKDECAALGRRGFQELQQFLKSDDYVSSGVSLFGWRDRRRVVDGYVQFSMKKCYHERSALALWLKTWDTVSCPRRFRALYSPCLCMDLRLVQRVDDDNIVLYRRIEHDSGSHRITKSIFLVTRFRTDAGYIVLFRSCRNAAQERLETLLEHVQRGSSTSTTNGSDTPAPKPEPVDDSQALSQPPPSALKAALDDTREEWHDVLGWLLFEELGDHQEDAQFYFGGRFDTHAATPQFWMLESILLSLRWEAAIVGPLISLS